MEIQSTVTIVEASFPALAIEQNPVTSDVAYSSSNSDTSGVVYTPPESIATMGSPSRDDIAVSSDANAVAPATTTASFVPNIGTAIKPISTSTSKNTNIPTGTCGDPNISKREYIYYLPYPLPPGTEVPYSIHLPKKNPLNLPSHQFEPTSTLVLTSPKNQFVDLRFYKPYPPHTTPLPNAGERDRLEWAFAGTSQSVAVDQTKRPKKQRWEGMTHSTWTHWVDSRWPAGSPDVPVDEGDMYPIADDLTLEHGHAFHAGFEEVKSHEEMWRDVQITYTNSVNSRICVVLRVQDDHAGVRGLVVRVGQYCQGIIMKGSVATVERWEFDTEADDKEVKNWKRTARIGDLFLPCAATFKVEALAVGGLVKYYDYEWVTEEIWEWK